MGNMCTKNPESINVRFEGVTYYIDSPPNATFK
jgi:hypothetical protein